MLIHGQGWNNLARVERRLPAASGARAPPAAGAASMMPEGTFANAHFWGNTALCFARAPSSEQRERPQQRAKRAPPAVSNANVPSSEQRERPSSEQRERPHQRAKASAPAVSNANAPPASKASAPAVSNANVPISEPKRATRTPPPLIPSHILRS